MIPNSNQHPYPEYWSEDPAFEQPPSPPAQDANAEQLADYKARVAAYEAKLTAAIDHGHWHALRVEGAGEPTKFIVRPLPSDATGLLHDMQRAGAGDAELFILAFRIALLDVPNLGVKVKPVTDARFGRIASLDWMAEAGILGMHGLRMLRELGARILTKASSLGPKP